MARIAEFDGLVAIYENLRYNEEWMISFTYTDLLEWRLRNWKKLATFLISHKNWVMLIKDAAKYISINSQIDIAK